jgi:hypothetical protein
MQRDVASVRNFETKAWRRAKFGIGDARLRDISSAQTFCDSSLLGGSQCQCQRLRVEPSSVGFGGGRAVELLH